MDHKISVIFTVLITWQLSDATQFVLGMFQMASNRGGVKEKGKKGRPKKRDQVEVENVLLDGFVDIQKWANEYLRVRFGQESTVIGGLVATVGAIALWVLL